MEGEGGGEETGEKEVIEEEGFAWGKKGKNRGLD